MNRKKWMNLLCVTFAMMFVFGSCTQKSDLSNEDGGNADVPPVLENIEDTCYYRADAGVNYEKPIGYFIENGETQYKIVIPENATPTEEFAASELSSLYVNLTGDKIETVSDANETFNTDNKVISIGKTVYQQNVDLSDVDYSKLTTGGFITKSFGNVFVLDSGCKNGIIYSAYNFLEIFFGLEFLTYQYTYIPDVKTARAYETDIIDIPYFPMRDYYSSTAFYDGQAFCQKMRMNSSRFNNTPNSQYDGSMYYAYTCEYNGSTYSPEKMGHTIIYWLAADAYAQGLTPNPSYKTGENGAHSGLPLGFFAQHPEWYAYQPNSTFANSRGYSQWEICYTNGLKEDGTYDETNTESVFHHILEMCKNIIRNDPNTAANTLMLGHGDSGCMCQCEGCLAGYKKYGGDKSKTISWTALYNNWINQMSKELQAWMEEEGIDRPLNISMFAYWKSVDPYVIETSDGVYEPGAPELELEDNIIVQMAYLVCNYHSVWDESCKENQQLRVRFEKWRQLADGMVIWDYTNVFSNFPWYLSNFQTIKDNYLYYKDVNVTHLLSQGCPASDNFYEHDLHQWVSMKLMWNPNRDVNKLIERFNELMFGKYGEAVNQYRALMENTFAIKDVTQDGGFHVSTSDTKYDLVSADNYSYTFLNKANNILQKALDSVRVDENLSAMDRERITLKLQGVLVTPQYMLLKLGYIVDEAEKNALAKKFFENCEAIGLQYVKEGGTAADTISAWKKTFDLD